MLCLLLRVFQPACYLLLVVTLSTFVIPELVTVGSVLELYSNPSLVAFHLPALQSVGSDMSIYYNDTLTFFELNSLVKITGDLLLYCNDELESFNMLSLTTISDNFAIYDNGALSTFRLDKLTQIGGTAFEVSGNPALAQCLVDALLAQIVQSDALNTSFGNNTQCSCDEAGGVLAASCPP